MLSHSSEKLKELEKVGSGKLVTCLFRPHWFVL